MPNPEFGNVFLFIRVLGGMVRHCYASLRREHQSVLRQKRRPDIMSQSGEEGVFCAVTWGGARRTSAVLRAQSALKAKAEGGFLLSSDEMERVKGIEPSSSAWEAAALPLSYTRMSAQICQASGRVKHCCAIRDAVCGHRLRARRLR